MKAKRKNPQNPPPYPIRHMAIWGSGFVIATIGVLPFLAFSSTSFFSLDVLMIAIISCTVGVIIGAINGVILKYKMPSGTLTNNQRDALYIGILLLTMALVIAVSYPFFALFLTMPALFAGILMMFATYRYRKKLKDWTNSQKEKSA